MSPVKPLCNLIGINPCDLSREENILLEAELFSRICEELKESFRLRHRDYFSLMKFTQVMENLMLEAKFVQLIIQDILATDEYNLGGIAYYTDTHEDVVLEVMLEKNTSPSATFLRKLIDLHRSVRHELYNALIKKITANYLAAIA